ncbi:Wzz/FepE/Etk N-terminal domain-containing protein [Aeromicrobium sp. NPDC092404]|uniref:Wzz/FepE/Etk N-terminal domain-containing protein n=1 Tax=Aeromicrobium sp. NPDC092404 TaxID=3154976 RepID=UPI003445DC37
MATTPQPVQITDIAGRLKRHWAVIAVLAILGLILGVLASFAVPASYTATTTVSVNPMSSDPLSSSVDSARSINMPTEQGLVTSQKVAAAAADLLDEESVDAEEVKEATSVDSPEDSLILAIHFSGDTARQAAAGADAVAEAYLMTRRSAASDEVDRLVQAATKQIGEIQEKSDKPAYDTPIGRRSLAIQADALGTKLADLSNVDLNPGQIVGKADTPSSPSTPSAVSLGLAGLFLGVLAGIPIALLRKEEDSEIGGVDGLHAIGDQIVLDGTKDTNRADTWDIAAFMLKIPTEIGTDGPFIILVDAEEGSGRSITCGQELADALQRRGRTARFVDAGAINEGKISRGWPTEKKRTTWAGEIIIIDTTHLTSDANKVALATRSDSVLLARSTTDDAAALRRFAGLLKSKNVDIALTALFPPLPELVALSR